MTARERPGAFYICRPMTIGEWVALPPKARGSTEDMTDATETRRVDPEAASERREETT